MRFLHLTSSGGNLLLPSLQILLLISLSLSLFIPPVTAQDDDDEDDGEFGDDDNDVESDGGGGFFGLGSSNFDEIGGGLFGDDGMDFMDSKRRNRFIPNFFRRPGDGSTIIDNTDEGTPVIIKNGEGAEGSNHKPYVHFYPKESDFRSAERDAERDFHHPRHHPRFSGDKGSQSKKQSDEDEFDDDRRRRYSGYDAEDDPKHNFQVKPHYPREDPMAMTRNFLSQEKQILSRHPYEAAFQVSRDFDRFPKGSFFGLDGLYGESRLVHDRPFPPLRIHTMSNLARMSDYQQRPCDRGCDEDKKKK